MNAVWWGPRRSVERSSNLRLVNASRESVTIRECGPRDGLQAEAPMSPADRAWLANALARTGLREIEAVSFVSPRAVPAMAHAAEVVRALHGPEVTWWGLVPNRRGAELAMEAGMANLTVTVSASPVYNEKNVGKSIDESLDEIRLIRALDAQLRIDAVVSCAFGSTFGDGVTASMVADLVKRLQDLGVDQLTLADTTGVATPRRVDAVIDHTGHDVGLHLHDTRATALTNALHALDLGVRRFDTSVGGIGGSPFAPGAGGNLATEDLVLVLEDLGQATGVDLPALIAVNHQLGKRLGRALPSRVGAAGPLPAFEG
jgi:hydroxymethylglutaryl-CoA lyase